MYRFMLNQVRQLHEDIDGNMTLVNTVIVAWLVLMFAFLFNAHRVTEARTRTQIAADVASASVGDIAADQMKEIVALNHTIGELLSKVLIHEAWGGPGLDEGETADTSKYDDALEQAHELYDAAAQAAGRSMQDIAFDTVIEEVIASIESTEYDTKTRLKGLLTWVYRVKATGYFLVATGFTPLVAIGEVLHTATHLVELKIYQEYQTANAMHEAMVLLVPLKQRIRDNVLPELKRQTDTIVKEFPELAEKFAVEAAESINDRFSVGVIGWEGEPQLPVEIDPLAKTTHLKNHNEQNDREYASPFNPCDSASYRRLLNEDYSDVVLKEVADANASFQFIDDGRGDYVYDEHRITIDKLPEGGSPEQFLKELLQGPNGAANDSLFNFVNRFDRRSSGPTTLGDIYDIDIAGPDNGSVVLSKQGQNYFIFSTIRTPELGSHPEHGSREFGFELNGDGSVDFYTRGASRARDFAVDWFGEIPQAASWARLMRGISDEIAARGGSPRDNSYKVTAHKLKSPSDCTGKRGNSKSRIGTGLTQLPADANLPRLSGMDTDVTRDQIVKVTQLARTTFPWVVYDREPLLKAMKLLMTLAQSEKHYKHYTEKYSKDVISQLQLEENMGLYVLKQHTFNKGYQLWTEDAALADQLFSFAVVVHQEAPMVIGQPIVFQQHNPDGIYSVSQVTLYNGNPQQRNKSHIDLTVKRIRPNLQPVVGYDTLGWTEKQNELIAKTDSGGAPVPRQPKYDTTWQSKLEPVSNTIYEAVRKNRTQLPKGAQPVAKKYFGERPSELLLQ